MLKVNLIICCLLLLKCLSGQDSNPPKKVKVLPVPVIGYSPETKTYLGAVTLFTLDFYNDSVTRTSNAQFEFNYTWNKQYIFESEWFYIFKGEEWISKGTVHFSEYPDLYYGIGYNASSDSELSYSSNRFLVDVLTLKKIGKSLFVGAVLKYKSYSKVSAIEDDFIFSELKDRSVFGFGASLLKDTRNSILTPTRGIYSYLNAIYNISETNYLKLEYDLRLYKTWKEKYTLASRFLNQLNSGNPPFYDYSMLGGDKFVRGYYLGRYRDKNLSTIQTEFRFHASSKISLVALGGISNVYSGRNNFKIKNSSYNYGLGFRYLVEKTEGTYLRLDYAIGQDNNSGFYISFGESF